MDQSMRVVRIFVASPSDVESERVCLMHVVDEINRTWGTEACCHMELVRWESHVAPDMGRPQEVVNRQIDPYDIFIGIMWKRFGTPTGEADSGTVEEFELAYTSWRQTHRPRIMFYFNTALYSLETHEEADQLSKVLSFRTKLEKHGLVWLYEGVPEFEKAVREHLYKAVRELDLGETTSVSPSQDEGGLLIFNNAFATWRTHGLYVGRDHLEVFAELDTATLGKKHLPFLIGSVFKCHISVRERWGFGFTQKEITEYSVKLIRDSADNELINAAISFLLYERVRKDISDCISILVHVIQDRKRFSASCRYHAIASLWFRQIPDEHAHEMTQLLLDVSDNESDFRFRRACARVLGEIATPEALKGVRTLLNDSIADVRKAAVWALCHAHRGIDNDEWVGLLIDRYRRDGSTKVRKEILSSLRYVMGNQRIARFFNAILRDPESPGTDKDVALDYLDRKESYKRRRRLTSQSS